KQYSKKGTTIQMARKIRLARSLMAGIYFFYGYKNTQFRQPYESGREITLNSGNRRNLPQFSPVQSPALRTKKHSLISRKFINFACANGLPLAASFIHEPTRTWLKKQKTTTILFRLMTGSSPST